MHNKKLYIYLFFLIILFVFSVNIFGDILVKVGVIDRDMVYETYKKKPLIDIKTAYLTDSFNKQALEYKEQLDELNKKLNDPNISDSEKATIKEQYDNLYNEARSLYDYTKKKLEDFKTNREKYIQDDITYAIRKVAEREGYSIILDIHADYLIYYSETVDLTQLVLDYLQEYIIKYCNENNIDVDKYVYGKTEEDKDNNNQNN